MPYDYAGPAGSSSRAQAGPLPVDDAADIRAGDGTLDMHGRRVGVAALSETEAKDVRRICEQLLEVRKETDPNDRGETPGGLLDPLVQPFRHLLRDGRRIRAATDALAELYPFRRSLPPEAWFSVFVLLHQIRPDRHVKLVRESLRNVDTRDLDWTLAVLRHWTGDATQMLPIAEFRHPILTYLIRLWHSTKPSEREKIGLSIGDLLSETVGVTAAQLAREWEAAFGLIPNIAELGGDLSEGQRLIAGGLLVSGSTLRQRCNRPEYLERLRGRLGDEFHVTERGMKRIYEARSAYVAEQRMSSFIAKYRELEAANTRPRYVPGSFTPTEWHGGGPGIV